MNEIKLNTKVKLSKSIGRDYGVVHPIDVISVGDEGIVIDMGSEDHEGKYPLYLVNFGPNEGYNISRKHWLRPSEII